MIKQISFLILILLLLPSYAIGVESVALNAEDIYNEFGLRPFVLIKENKQGIDGHPHRLASAPGDIFRIINHPIGKNIIVAAGEYLNDHKTIVIILSDDGGVLSLINFYEFKTDHIDFITYRHSTNSIYIVFRDYSDECAYIDYIDNGFVLNHCDSES